jgi:hypothetical protein
MNTPANDNYTSQEYTDIIAVDEFMRLTDRGLPFELAATKAKNFAFKETAREFGREL